MGLGHAGRTPSQAADQNRSENRLTGHIHKRRRRLPAILARSRNGADVSPGERRRR